MIPCGGESYQDFSQPKVKLASDASSSVSTTEITPIERKADLSLEELIRSGESRLLEFKSSMRWNIKESKVDKKMEEIVLKTISAFNNADGGTLLIGVSDDGEILGLDSDYSSLKNGNKDTFEIHLRNLINSAFGKNFAATQISIGFPVVEEKEICEIKIGRGIKALYCETSEPNLPKVKRFYLRSGNTSQELDIEETASYISNRF